VVLVHSGREINGSLGRWNIAPDARGNQALIGEPILIRAHVMNPRRVRYSNDPRELRYSDCIRRGRVVPSINRSADAIFRPKPHGAFATVSLRRSVPKAPSRVNDGAQRCP
jgi:hypothetical protein